METAADQIGSGRVSLATRGPLALLSNRAARTASGLWTGEALVRAGYALSALLTPEHGLSAGAAAGLPIPHDPHTDVPILSLYGAEREPVEAALHRVDGVVVDLPDVGCRYYTYNWSVRELMRLAGASGVPLTVLDRPNPLGGVLLEGNLPDPGVESAVCASHVPVRHGLTIGELARWNREYFGINVDLRVIPVAGWDRTMLWPDTGPPWTPPSPALRSFGAALLYPGTCLLEGTNVSEGRGTEGPFAIVGAPFVDGDELAGALSQTDALNGIAVEPGRFTPEMGKWAGSPCSGVRLSVREPALVRPVLLGLVLISLLARYSEFQFLEEQFDALAGTSHWRTSLKQGEDSAAILASCEPDVTRFMQERESILLYPHST